jgi:3-methyladenine DNA glycosylase AlkD
MKLYDELLSELNFNADLKNKAFMAKLLKNDKINVLGVKIPTLRLVAKKYSGNIDELIDLPDDYFEVTFVKLLAVSQLNYQSFLSYLDECVKRIDNWATCDSFKAKCISKNKQDFLKYIDKYLSENSEFYQRYALVSLLQFYVEEEYLNKIFECVQRADTNYFYVHMAAAWLIAEVLAKYFDEGLEFLKRGSLDKKTHNKAIQKATESFRISEQDKNILRSIKR